MVSDLRLRSSGQLLLDTCALIYFLTGLEPYFGLLQPLFRRAQRGEASVLLSAVSEAELLVRPLRDGNEEAVERIGDFLSEDGIYVIGMDRRIARSAARLRATLAGIKLPDAIIMATALQTGCDAIVSNDRAWLKLNEVPVVHLDDLVGRPD